MMDANASNHSRQSKHASDLAADTLPKYFLKNYRRFQGDKIAMREKDRGIWKSYTWSDYYHNVKFLSLCFISMGLEPGDRVAIIGENTPEVYWGEMAAMAARAITFGIFSDCSSEEVKYFINHAEASFILAHDQEQIDKILEIKDELSGIRKVIYWDDKGLWSYDDPLIMPMAEALEIGRTFEEKHPELFEERIISANENETCVILYTSGTTGLPKGAMLNHKAMLAGARSLMEVDRYSEKDNYLSFVPIAWIVEQLLGIASSVMSGFIVNFPESAETVNENIRELGPRIIFFSPRQWESINRMVQSKILDTTWLKKKMYHLFLPVGIRLVDVRLSGKNPGVFLRFMNTIANWLIFRPLKDNLGLLCLRAAYTAGSAVSPDIITFFQGIGVNVKQLYGSSEMGLVTSHRDNNIRPETSGTPLPGAKIKLSPEGEILVKNTGMFSGYYNAPGAFEKKMSDGWYQSGDYGHIDEHGQLIVVDRMEDLRLLKGGKKFSPQYPEIRLRFSPFIKEALVVGGETRDYAACLVSIDLDNVGQWAEVRKIVYTTFADLSQKEEVVTLIKEEIEKINQTIPEEARIKKFINMPKEFDADESELTRSRKLRRTFLEERYRDLIDGLYSSKNTMDLETSIVYRDGKKSLLKKTITISTLK